MKRYLSVCGLILIWTLAAPAHDNQNNAKPKPDPTGNWLLDRKKSNVGPAATPDVPLKVTYRDPELRITHKVHRNGQAVDLDFVFYSDGRGETNPSTSFLSTSPDANPQAHEKDITKSRTKWSGNKLVTRSILRNSIMGRMVEFELVDEWKLSSDGKTLTQTSRIVFQHDTSGDVFIPANRPDVKRVYNRVPD